MPEALFYTVILFLSLIGLATLIRWCCLRFLLPKSGLPAFLLVPIDRGNAEGKLRMTAEAARQWAPAGCKGVLAVDLGLDAEERLVCEKLCGEYENITMCTLNDLENVVYQNHVLWDE